MAKLGILFDIGDLGEGLYGKAAYDVLFDAVDPRRLARCGFRDGDTASTLRGKEDRFCIAIESPDAVMIAYVRERVGDCRAKGLAPPSDRFLGEEAVKNEPLVAAGRIGPDGIFAAEGDSWGAIAWKRAVERLGPPTPAPAGDRPSSRGSEAPAQGPRPEAATLYAFMLMAERPSPDLQAQGMIGVRMRPLEDWKDMIRGAARAPGAAVEIIEPESWNPPNLATFTEDELRTNQRKIMGQIQKAMDSLGMPSLDPAELVGNSFVYGSRASGRIFYVIPIMS
jgi:hypothetical protein